MDFVSKDQLKISLARVKTWIENRLFGFVPRSEDPAGTLIADSDGLHDGPNDEYYYLPGSDGAMDANADADHTLATYGYVDAAVFSGFTGRLGTYSVTSGSSSRVIPDSSTAVLIQLVYTGGSGTTPDVTLPSNFLSGRLLLIVNDVGGSNAWIIKASSGKTIKKMGASSTTSQVSIALGKAYLFFATSSTSWRYIELN